MFAPRITRSDLKKLSKLIESANNVVITCHVKPDGDAVGSTLALYHIIGALGKKATVLAPDAPPRYLRFLPGCRDIAAFSADPDFGRQTLDSADLIFCLDFNALSRVDRMEEALREAAAPKVMIDHHLEPEQFARITVSAPQDSSTCLLVFKVICALGLRQFVNKDVATCVAAGMMTDTGNFSYNANDPEAYTVMALLLEHGIDKVGIWERLNIKSENQLRLNGYALSEKMTLVGDGKASLIALSAAELERFGYQKGDLEGLVNVPLQMPDVQMSVLLHQEPGFIKASMRSTGKIPVNKVCEKYFGGGGHLNAAGGEFKGTLDQAAELLVKVLPEFEEYFR